jgi:DNA invertase Pin-like site-specific DNA recombinase
LVSRFAISSEAAGPEVREPIPAAQYVRMSTEHQCYSTENQSDAILQYAVRYGFDVVRTDTTRPRADFASRGATR